MSHFRLIHTEIKTVWTVFYVDQKYQSTDINSLFWESLSLYQESTSHTQFHAKNSQSDDTYGGYQILVQFTII